MKFLRIVGAVALLCGALTVRAGAPFTTLPQMKSCEGLAEVRVAGTSAWSPAEEGRFYALGSAYRVRAGGRLVLAFGEKNTATISGEASFTTRAQALGVPARTVELGTGVLELDLSDKLPAGAFLITAPGFCVKDPAGRSRFEYAACGDGDDVQIRCVTGLFKVEGRHFAIAQMRAADALRIRTTHDYLETFMYGISGDYVVSIDRGTSFKVTVADDGSRSESTEKGTLEWHLSPQTKVRISRRMPSVGSRMSVAVMTFDTTGKLKNHFAFSEDRAEVNTGELVAETVAENAELAKKKVAPAAEDKASAEQEKAAEDDGEAKQDKEEKVEKKTEKSEEEEEK